MLPRAEHSVVCCAMVCCGVLCSPSDTEVEEAARAANAHEFITGLPEGYDTLITGGCGGQAGRSEGGGDGRDAAIP